MNLIDAHTRSTRDELGLEVLRLAGRAQEVEVKVVTHRTTAQQAALAGVERELDSLVQTCGEADCSSAAAQVHHSYQH